MNVLVVQATNVPMLSGECRDPIEVLFNWFNRGKELFDLESLMINSVFVAFFYTSAMTKTTI